MSRGPSDAYAPGNSLDYMVTFAPCTTVCAFRHRCQRRPIMLFAASSFLQLAAFCLAVLFGSLAVVLAIVWWWFAPRTSSRSRSHRSFDSKRGQSRLETGSREFAEPRATRHATASKGRRALCPECGLEVRQRRLEKHRHNAHGTVKHCRLCNQYIRADGMARHNAMRHGVDSDESLPRPVVQCTRCHNKVLRKNLVKHFGRQHDINLRPACGWHPLVAAVRREHNGYWVIDGLNIVRMQGQDAPRLDFLLALTKHLFRSDRDFLCVFDASARPALQRFQGSHFSKLCRQLIEEFPSHFSEVPKGTVADDAILDIASIFGSKVITNDQFRDHVERHPWLETRRDEMLYGVEVRRQSRRRRDLLCWQEETIEVPSSRRIRSFGEQYREELAAWIKGRESSKRQ